MQLELTAIDNPDVSPPEVFPGGVPHQQGLWTLKIVVFTFYFSCATTAMISPHYHAFSCNVYMCYYDYISILWTQIL